MAAEHSYIKFVPGIYVVYLSVPKAASSSISYTMMLHAATADPQIPEHSALGKVLTNRRAITRPFPKLPIFTFVRHPIDRFISYYRDKFHRIKDTAFDLVDLPKLGFDPQMSIDEVVAHMMTIPVEIMEHHAQPQWRILVKEGKLLADYVGKFESIQDDWGYISALSLTNFDMQYPRNITLKNMDAKISDASVSALYQYYKSDFALFDYQKPEIVTDLSGVAAGKLTLSMREIDKLKVEVSNRNAKWKALCEKLDSTKFYDNYKREVRRIYNQFLQESYIY